MSTALAPVYEHLVTERPMSREKLLSQYVNPEVQPFPDAVAVHCGCTAFVAWTYELPTRAVWCSSCQAAQR